MALQPLKTHKIFEGRTQYWEHDSKETKTKMKFSTFIPNGSLRGAVVWLSGLTCTEENFMIKAGAQRAAAQHQLMLICPDTSPRGLNLPLEHDAYDFGSGASFYLDAATFGYRDHYRMESYITQEFQQLIASEFSVSLGKISIMGHSMGGHGALTLGLKHPTQYQSISAFSPIVNPTKCPWGIKAFKGYLGDDQEEWTAFDATELVANAGKRHSNPILIDQGLQDEFLEKQLLTDNFVQACKKADQPLEVHFREGYDHSYYFISTFIDSHLAFHAKALK